jgi:PAS domain S-box-containing protein
VEAVYTSLPFGVALLTPDLRYRSVNPALAEINGRPVEEHLGRTVREIMGTEADAAERMTREAIASGQAVEREFAVPAPGSTDGERRFDVACFPVYRDRQELLGVGTVVREVTDRHRANAERDALLREALISEAHAQAAAVRTQAEREQSEAALLAAERERAAADAARRRASFLATVTQRLASSMDIRATLREVVASAVPYIADWCLVSLIEPDGALTTLGFAHRDPARERLAEQFAAAYRPVGGLPVARALDTGRPVVLSDVTPARLTELVDDSEQRALLERLGVCHWGTWPIPDPRGGVLGTLSLVLDDSGRRFGEEDLDLARALATRAGLHISNARLYAERSEIARTLQASLLPRELPQIPGVELASALLPAGDQNIVGGDFFDVFPTGEAVWAAILGDVSGKGARAAAITAAARHTLRTAAVVSPDPAANLALLNRMLIADLSVPEFCTAVCALLRPAPGRLEVTLAFGGHPPAMLLRATGRVQPVLGGRGPLIGMFAEAEFEAVSLELGPGDLLLLYTDGVTDVRQAAGDGEQALAATLRSQRGRSARQVVDAVAQAALRRQTGGSRDDIALLAIRVPA